MKQFGIKSIALSTSLALLVFSILYITDRTLPRYNLVIIFTFITLGYGLIYFKTIKISDDTIVISRLFNPFSKNKIIHLNTVKDVYFRSNGNLNIEVYFIDNTVYKTEARLIKSEIRAMLILLRSHNISAYSNTVD